MSKRALARIPKRIIVAFVVGLLAGIFGLSEVTALANPKPKAVNLGSCSVTPSPAAKGQVFAVTGLNVPTGFNGGYIFKVKNGYTEAFLAAGSIFNNQTVGPIQWSEWNAGSDTFQLYGRTKNGNAYSDTPVTSECNVTIK